MFQSAVVIASIAAIARAQQVGTNVPETHPPLTWSVCTGRGVCQSRTTSVVVDANWRWLHSTSDSTNCYTGNLWDKTLCPDNVKCAANCALEGANYASTYGITTTGDALILKFITHGEQTNVGSRTYLMSDDTHYQQFILPGRELTFDVDVSNMPCGINGALYFVSMPADGGISATNKAGAKYGTGYCDSQCPRDMKFIAGQANTEGWVPSTNDPNAGTGNYGSCCPEMDIWEANSISSAFTPHPCSNTAPTRCPGDACGGTYSPDRYAGTCDPDGCDFNSFRMGDKSFYGPGMTVDTKRKFTVTTQFIETGGEVTEIKRYYIQDGKVIPNSQSTIPGVKGNSITEPFCTAQKAAFTDNTGFMAKGGLAAMSRAMSAGMTLVMSIWDDHHADMDWLDSTAPTGKTGPGVARGTCSTSAGVPATVQAAAPDSSVIFSNIRWGLVGTTTTEVLTG